MIKTFLTPNINSVNRLLGSFLGHAFFIGFSYTCNYGEKARITRHEFN